MEGGFLGVLQFSGSRIREIRRAADSNLSGGLGDKAVGKEMRGWRAEERKKPLNSARRGLLLPSASGPTNLYCSLVEIRDDRRRRYRFTRI